jgi:S1-C subfamily serine protease
MSRLLLQALAILACIQCGTAVAQDLGPLLPPGPSPQRSPVLERYSLEGGIPGSPAPATLSSVLGRVDHAEPGLRLRGAREIQLYRTLAPAVALILTDKSEGSASLIASRPGTPAASGTLLTNAHVVGDAREVAVIFKPAQDGAKINPADAVIGRVRKVDPIRDLALVDVANVPASVTVIALGAMKDVAVGADVHAIGHPAGQTWTYTKGLVSQIRPDFEWQPDPSGTRHLAEVIQTQTPINPGNSGGPLIDESGRLIGVNSFKGTGELLNFAVSVREVEKFLTAAQGGAFEPKLAAATSRPCAVKVMYEGRTQKDDAFIRNVDLDCSGRANATLFVPDDKAKPIVFRIDTNHDGKVDAEIYDEDRDGKWDYSLWDTDFDGTPDLIGYHPDGKLKPSRYEKYKPKT